jgi:hypothetical protein
MCGHAINEVAGCEERFIPKALSYTILLGSMSARNTMLNAFAFKIL